MSVMDLSTLMQGFLVCGWKLDVEGKWVTITCGGMSLCLDFTLSDDELCARMYFIDQNFRSWLGLLRDAISLERQKKDTEPPDEEEDDDDDER